MGVLGVFDSGVGGLTVLAELKRLMPDKHMIYFGDTARIPYGSKSASVVTRYALQDCRFLLSKGVSAIIAACGTVSANSVDILKSSFSVNVYGVVDGAVSEAVSAAKNGNGKILVLGTSATVKSKAYERKIKAVFPEATVFSQACPMFVPLAENGYASSPVASLFADEYLSGYVNESPSAVILGCTHYPLLKDVIASLFVKSVLISAGAETARRVSELGDTIESGECEYYVSDDAVSFAKTAVSFLNEDILSRTTEINIEDY